MKLTLVCKCKKCGELADIKNPILNTKGYHTGFYKYKCDYCEAVGEVYLSEIYALEERY